MSGMMDENTRQEVSAAFPDSILFSPLWKAVMNETEITLWDDNAGRINSMEPNLRVALQRLGLKARIQTNCEPPLLARHNLTGTTPAVQINGGDYWRHTVGQAVSADQFEALLRRLQSLGQLA